MNKREKNRIRTKALKKLTADELQQAREAWNEALAVRRRPMSLADINAARLSMLSALAAGTSIPDAAATARQQLTA